MSISTKNRSMAEKGKKAEMTQKVYIFQNCCRIVSFF